MERVNLLQMQHRHVIDIVAFYWNMESVEVLDGIVDNASTLPFFLNIFVEYGRSLCILYNQEGSPPPLG